MAHKHWPKDHPYYAQAGTCNLTKAECERRYREWTADEWVRSAQGVVDRGGVKRYRREHGQFAQLIRWLAGEGEDILNSEGVPSQEAWAKQLRAAYHRHIAAKATKTGG